jgi:diaminohydroxyphosphoribosylaminopyrimidine deaminase / 5-amino-6-(5-phosphoribosylamino)uracil reductase
MHPPPTPTARDRAHLERAVLLGRRGWGRVHPNPMVGCVLVRPGPDGAGTGTGPGSGAGTATGLGANGAGDRVLGEGWHRSWGGPHAEVEALAAARAAGHDPRGATAYVSLEPCHHQGKTPPCTMALRDAGVSRVVFGAADPGVHSGGGGAALAGTGVEVVGPVFSPDEARRENPAFFHAFGPERHRPWVVLKLALSADGFIAARPGERTPISGPEAQERVHHLRAGVDAILVGGRTALVDDPLLTVRGSVEPRVTPLRVVLDPDGALPAEARLFHEGEGGAVVFVGDDAAGPADGLPSTARVERLPVDRSGPVPRFDLHAVLLRLRALGVSALLCEGGGALASALLRAGLVDRLVLVESERPLGPGGVPAFPDSTPGGTAPLSFAPGGRAVDGQPLGGWSPVAEPLLLGPDRWRAWDRVPEGAGGPSLRQDHAPRPETS